MKGHYPFLDWHFHNAIQFPSGGKFSSFTTTIVPTSESFGYRILPFGSLLELMIDSHIAIGSRTVGISPATIETEKGDSL